MATTKKPEWLDPSHPVLKKDVAKAAIEGQISTYPKVVRGMKDDPISGQTHSLLSFMFFSEPKTLSDGSIVYGYIKSRGNWGDEEQAIRQSSRIVKEQDSKYEIRIAPTGSWVPITTSSVVVKEHIDVKTDDNQHALRDEAVREKERHRRKLQREIEERTEEAKSGDIYDDPESVTYYSMRRVTEIKLIEARNKQFDQLENIKDKLGEVQKELYDLECKFPEYENEWVDVYNAERKKSGILNYTPSEDQENEHKTMMKTLAETSST